MQQAVAAVGEGVDDREQARDADGQAGVERDVGLGHCAQPPVDTRVGPDHLDLEARHPALADLGDGAADAVDGAEAVGDERDAQRLAVAAGHALALAGQERRRGRVRDGGDAGLEHAGGDSVPIGGLAHLRHGGGQLALVAAPRPPLEPGVREAIGLEAVEQHPLVGVELDGLEPRAQHCSRVARTEVADLRLVA